MFAFGLVLEVKVWVGLLILIMAWVAFARKVFVDFLYIQMVLHFVLYFHAITLGVFQR